MTAVDVRRATGADVPALAELRRAFTLEDDGSTARPQDEFEQSFTAIVTRGIDTGQWIVWVAEVDGEIVSHAFVGLIEKIPRPVNQLRSIGYLTNVYTVPAHRGTGIGSCVLAATTEWAQQASVELLMVWPSEQSVGTMRATASRIEVSHSSGCTRRRPTEDRRSR